ncbi:MAG TPA: radical SAM protein, partial [bacterium]|nr:radical SAM protein [bacterium]
MKVVLVAPPSEKGKYEHGNQSLPKIGLGYLASMLEAKGIPCEIIDAKFERLSLDEVLSRLNALKPDLVGLTAMTPDICDAALVARQAKGQNPKCWTIVGGPHAMALPRETMEEFHEFDLLIAAEGEYALVDVVRALEENRAMENIAGVAFRKDGQVYVNPVGPWIDNLDSLPFPAWSKYPSHSDVYYVLAVRGCPYRCVFCMRSMGKTPRRRSPENVVQEIQWLVQQHHAKEFIFIDETFGLNREHVAQMLALLTDRGLHRTIRWTAQTRVDRVDEDLLRSTRTAGCYRVEFGIESGNQKILDAVQKGTTLQQAEYAVRLAKKSGLQVGCSFILGHPHETRETAQD